MIFYLQVMYLEHREIELLDKLRESEETVDNLEFQVTEYHEKVSNYGNHFLSLNTTGNTPISKVSPGYLINFKKSLNLVTIIRLNLQLSHKAGPENLMMTCKIIHRCLKSAFYRSYIYIYIYQ